MLPFVGVSLAFRTPRALSAPERTAILTLAETVLHVDREWFEESFNRYDEVILYRRRRTGALIGVTGLRLIDTEHEGEGVRLFYTGSVVLHPDWRGRGLVPWAGLRAIARHGTTARRLYWLMETDNWRAYALAAGNTRDCWPRDAARSPNPLYDHVCKSVYRDDWDAERRVCRPIAQRRLRPEVAHIPPSARAANRHARAYADLNPGHADGDALPVLVPLDRDNIAHFAWRMCLHAARPARRHR